MSQPRPGDDTGSLRLGAMGSEPHRILCRIESSATLDHVRAYPCTSPFPYPEPDRVLGNIDYVVYAVPTVEFQYPLPDRVLGNRGDVLVDRRHEVGFRILCRIDSSATAQAPERAGGSRDKVSVSSAGSIPLQRKEQDVSNVSKIDVSVSSAGSIPLQLRGRCQC